METVLTTKAKIEKIDAQIIKVSYEQQDGKVEEKDIKEILDAALEMMIDEKKGLYVVTGEHTLLTKDARLLIAEETQNWDKMAIHIHSLAQRIMGNFVMRLKGVKGRLKLVTNEADAMAWINGEQ